MTGRPRVLFILGIITITALIACGFFFYQYQKTQKEIESLKANPSTFQAQDEVKKLVQEVGNLMELPQDEEPTIATVTDSTKLQNQAFFQKAKNGDKVLLFTNSKKAILYDPVARKIIDIAPISIGSSSGQQASSSAQPANVRLALRNGTSKVGLTQRIETELKKNNSNIEVTSKENAEKKDYDRTIIVSLKDSFKDTAAKLAKELKGSVEAVPAGENTPEDADIMIIVGKNQT